MTSQQPPFYNLFGGLEAWYSAQPQRLPTTYLEFLYLQGHQALPIIEAKLMQFEGELMKRQPERKSSQGSLPLARHCQCLHDIAKDLRATPPIEDSAIEDIHRGIVVLVLQQERPLSDTYRLFLDDVLRECGAAIEVLCMASLSEASVVQTTEDERQRLIMYVKAAQGSLEVPILWRLVQRGRVPRMSGLPIARLLQLARGRA